MVDQFLQLDAQILTQCMGNQTRKYIVTNIKGHFKVEHRRCQIWQQITDDSPFLCWVSGRLSTEHHTKFLVDGLQIDGILQHGDLRL